jgi:hypothetical protein
MVTHDAGGVIFLGGSSVASVPPDDAPAHVARIVITLNDLVDEVESLPELAAAKASSDSLHAAYDPLRRRLTEIANLDPLPRRRCKLCSS